MTQTQSPQNSQEKVSQRLDIWLFRTRLVKSRSLAQNLVNKGKVRLTRNGQTLRIKKPHIHVNQGDILTFMRGRNLMNVEVLGMGDRRGPASEAQTFYRKIEAIEKISALNS